MRIYLFDIDGTLTPARQPIVEGFARFFEDFCKDNTVYLCTGSDFAKIREQLPDSILKLVRGIFSCSGNAYWAWEDKDRPADFSRIDAYTTTFDPPDDLINDLQLFVESSDSLVKTGKHIEARTGMLNFSTIGRGCSQEEREEYSKWDKEVGEREKLASILRKKYQDLSFNIGGQISIDIHPKGSDKSRAIRILREIHEESEISIHFFGDKLQPGGNDYPVLKELGGKDTFEKVSNYEDTWELLKNEKEEAPKVSTNAEALKPKPSTKFAPRGIETFTICRQADESGISGTGVVIEGVEYATGQVVLHWLTPFPKGSIAIFESLTDFKRVHINPHPTNKTIITWSDGRQEEF